MYKRLIALLLSTVMVSSTLSPLTVYAKKIDNSEEERESVYETGTQRMEEDRIRENKEKAEAVDGSFNEDKIEGSEESSENTEFEEIYISTSEEFRTFAKNCSYDKWSKNKKVYLTEDLTLTNGKFDPVPSFGGYFDGGNHTINGYFVTDSISHAGLFSYVQEGAVIENLNLVGSVKPDGDQEYVAGFAATNEGEIRNCTFSGLVKGEKFVGGICGVNELSGIVVNCSVAGKVYGTYYTGGICGKNAGSVVACKNSANVNDTFDDEEHAATDMISGVIEVFKDYSKEITPGNINLGSIDTGGICGVSIGVIKECNNTGNIGYNHKGYNVGGIVGRQSGYVSGCSNAGEINGRKDIGGIVGQAEPYVKVKLTEDTLDSIDDNLKVLNNLVDRALEDTRGEKNTIKARLDIIKGFTDKALDDTEYISNETINLVNSFSDSGQELLNRADYALDELAKKDGALDDTEDAFDSLKRTTSSVKKLTKDADVQSYLNDEEKKLYEDNLKRTSEISEYYAGAFAKAETTYNSAYNNYIVVMALKGDAAGTKYPDSHDLVAYDSEGNEVPESVIASFTSWKQFAYIAGFAHADGTPYPSNTSDTALYDDAKKATVANEKEISLAASDAATQACRAKFGADYETDLTNSTKTLLNILAAHAEEIKKATGKDVDTSVNELDKAASKLEKSFDEVTRVAKEIKDKPDIKLPKISQTYRETTESLNNNLSAISGNMGDLSNEISGSSDKILDDFKNVNDQFNVIMDLFSDAIDDLDKTKEDLSEDLSMEVAEVCTDATVDNSINNGYVTGDINVGGVAGTMAVEYDFDLESDITDFSASDIGKSYTTKCVLRNNKNYKRVSAETNHAGGVCAKSEFGTVISCSNFGRVECKDGDYVGGVCGESSSYIQKCIFKGFLEGKNYVGGIAGKGKNILNSLTMPMVYESESYTGSIAGKVSEDGKIRYNYFVSDDYAGIDRVSYEGKAEPVSYEEMLSFDRAPEEFKDINVTFYVEDPDEEDKFDELITKTYKYGQTFGIEDYPDIAKEEDFYIEWDSYDNGSLTHDVEIYAENKRFNLTLSSTVTRAGGQSVVLVDGNFGKKDFLTVTSLEAAKTGVKGAVEAYGVTVPYDGKESHLVRYAELDSGLPFEIYVKTNGNYEKVKYDTFGKYATFNVTGSEFEVCLVELPKDRKDLIIQILVAFAALLIVIRLIKSIIRTYKANVAAMNKDKDEKADGLKKVDI